MATRPPRTDDGDPTAPEWWRRSASFRRWPIVVVLLLAFIIVRGLGGGTPPAITKSCTTPALALSTKTTQPHHEVKWSVTGPPGMRYLVMIGVSGFVSTDDQLIATPDVGRSKQEMQPGSQRMTMDGDCLQDGRFGVLVPVGSYPVRVFRLERRNGHLDAVDVAEQSITVTGS